MSVWDDIGKGLERAWDKIVDVFTPDIDMPEENGQEVSVYSTQATLPVIIGKVLDVKAVSVPFIGLSGTDNDLLHKVAVFSKAVTSIDAVRVDGIDAESDDWEGWLHHRKFQTSMSGYNLDDLINDAGFKPGEYRFTDMASVYVRAEWGSDVVTSEPSDIRADLTGRGVNYNLGSNSTGDQWRTNGVLQLYHYLINAAYGPKWSASLIHLDSWRDSANACNQQIETFLGSNEYRDYMTMNGVLDLSQNVHEIIETFRKALNAHMPFIDGQYHLYVEQDSNYASIEILDDDILGGIQTSESADVGEKVNQVMIKYQDKLQNGSTVEAIYPAEGSATDLAYLAQDNQQRKSITLDQPFCNNYSEALQLGKMKLEISREGLQAQFVVKPRCRSLHTGQVVKVTNTARGWNAKPFRILGKTLHNDLYSDLKLREHQPYIYDPHNIDTSQSIPDTTLNPSALTKPSSLQIIDSNLGGKKATWSSSYAKFDYQIELNNVRIASGMSQIGTAIELHNLVFNNEYIFAVRARNNIGQTSGWTTTTFTYDIDTAEANLPTNTFLPEVKAPVVETDLLATQEQFVWKIYYSVVDHGLSPDISASDFGGLAQYVSGQTFVIPSPLPSTTYYIWFGLIKKSQANGTPTQWVKQQVTSGVGISTEYFSSELNNTLGQFSSEITKTNLALDVAKTNISDAKTNINNALDSWATSILQDVDNQEALLGTYARIEVIDTTILAHTTAISQSASQIQLAALESSLRSDINSLLFGDESDVISFAIGEVVGRLEQVEVLLEPDAFQVSVNNILAEKDYVNVSYVEQQINALGIENYVTETTFNENFDTINSAVEILHSNVFKRSITSFTKVNADIEETKNQTISARLDAMLEAVETEELRGSLASQQTNIDAITDEQSAQVTQTSTQIAAVNERVSSSNQAIATLVNEQQTTATKLEEITASETGILAAAQEYTRTTIGVCIDASGKITNHTDAVSCQLVEGNSWVTNMALAEQLNKVQLTITDENDDEVTISAGSLFQVLKDENNALKARAFFGFDLPDGETVGITATSNEDGSLSEINFYGAALNWLTPGGDPVFNYDSLTNTISIPAGTLTLTNQQVNDLKGATGLSAYETWLAAGNSGTNAEFIASLTGPTGLSAYETWLAAGNSGTNAEFIASLTGPTGLSAYETWLAAGNSGTNAEFIASLTGPTGLSAYETWLAAGNSGTNAEFIASLTGPTGLSAYETWLAAGNSGTNAEFIASLKGDTGEAGAGSFTWINTSHNGTWPSNSTINAWLERSAKIGDQLTISNNSITAPKISTRVFNGSSWITPLALFDGSIIARGSISATALKADEVLANSIYAENIQGDVTDSIVKTTTGRNWTGGTNEPDDVAEVARVTVEAANFDRVITCSLLNFSHIGYQSPIVQFTGITTASQETRHPTGSAREYFHLQPPVGIIPANTSGDVIISLGHHRRSSEEPYYTHVSQELIISIFKQGGSLS